jgi:hypothetical protein
MTMFVLMNFHLFIGYLPFHIDTSLTNSFISNILHIEQNSVEIIFWGTFREI